MRRDYKILFSYAPTERTPSIEEIAKKISESKLTYKSVLWAELEVRRGWNYLVCWPKEAFPYIRIIDVYPPSVDEGTAISRNSSSAWVRKIYGNNLKRVGRNPQ